MTNRKVNLTIANMVVMLALLAALIGAGWQQVGAQRGRAADECSAKVDKRADKEDAHSDCEHDEKSEGDKGDDGMVTIAALIGIDVRTLWGELKAGNSIADVAQANGVDPQTIIDALVSQKQAEIDEAVAAGKISPEKGAAWQAKLVEGVTSFVNETAEALENDGKRDEKGDDGMEMVANLIGIDVRTLWGEIKAGNSIADVAQANGVDPQTIIDALVAQKQAEIDELLAAGDISEEKAAAWQAKLVEGVTFFVNETAEALENDGKRDEKGDDGMEMVANLIGIDVRTLWGELKAGNSIADVAQANGVDPQTIIDALVAQKQAEIDELLAAGEISEEKAAAWQAELVEGITSRVNMTFEGDRRHEK